MKITKGKSTPVKADTDITKRNDMNTGVETAKRHIKCAIDALGKSAINGDAAAKSAIADLSVVLFSMK